MAGRMLLLFSILLVAPWTTCISLSPDLSPHPCLLVLLDDLAVKYSHSLFFDSLSDRGYKLDFKISSDSSLALKKYGDYLFDGLILFSPSVEKFGGSVDLAGILDFVDSGRDLIIAGDLGMSDTIRDVASECGVDFEEDPEAVVIDHLNFASTQDQVEHSLIAVDSIIESSVIMGEESVQAPVLFHGVAHSVAPANNMAIKVLTGSPTAYSANPKTHLKEPPTLNGSSIGLVSVMQVILLLLQWCCMLTCTCITQLHAFLVNLGLHNLDVFGFVPSDLQRKWHTYVGDRGFVCVGPHSVQLETTSVVPYVRNHGFVCCPHSIQLEVTSVSNPIIWQASINGTSLSKKVRIGQC